MLLLFARAVGANCDSSKRKTDEYRMLPVRNGCDLRMNCNNCCYQEGLLIYQCYSFSHVGGVCKMLELLGPAGDVVLPNVAAPTTECVRCKTPRHIHQDWKVPKPFRGHFVLYPVPGTLIATIRDNRFAHSPGTIYSASRKSAMLLHTD